MSLKNIGLAFILSCVAAPLFAQDASYFIYLQSDQNQLFYVRENGKILSSSRTGYLIIPQLKKGDQQIIVGFPKNKFPEQLFSVTLDSNQDEGFLLKQNGKNEFALYNLQNYAMLTPQAISNGVSFAYNPHALPSATNNTTVSKDTLHPKNDSAAKEISRFKQLLHAAANEGKPATVATSTDTAATVINVPEPPDITANIPAGTTADVNAASGNNITPTDSVQNNNNNDNEVIAKDTTNKIIAKNPPALVDTAQQNNIAFNQENNNPATTIIKDSVSNNIPSTNATPDVSNNDTVTQKGFPFRKEKNKKQDASSIAFIPGISTQGIKPQASLPAAGNNQSSAEENTSSGHELQMINSDCKSLVNDDKFEKVRRKMAAESDEESMLRIAMRYLKEDCYSVQQLQGLTYLFNTDEYRYRFLDLAYPHTYDTDHFLRLENTLTSDYYRQRFHAMIKK